ncbi:MAG: hypothetical protein ACJ8AO_14005 [Gemmatimonadaceae bacterium]
MPDQFAARARSLANVGLHALGAGDRAHAEYAFARALSWVEEVGSPDERRDLYRELGFLLYRARLGPLAVDACRAAVAVAFRTEDPASFANALLDYGNALSGVRREVDAGEIYRQALDLFVACGRFADAASASTNRAIALANAGRLSEARELLERSLEYVRREPFPDTEVKTRLGLIQVLAHLGEDPDRVFDLAASTGKRWRRGMTPDDAQVFDQIVGPVIARYLAAHPGAEARTVVARRLPGYPLPPEGDA